MRCCLLLWDSTRPIDFEVGAVTASHIGALGREACQIENGRGSSIAGRFCISIWYLHLLFEDVGVSVSNWIIQRRLEKCRRELVRSGPVKSNFTEIAFK